MILCCGEALIDMIPGPDGRFAPLPGGAVFNTAIALGRLGAPVGMLTGLSRDAFGRQLEATLIENGVDTGHLIRSDRLTTLAVVHLQNSAATYAFYDEESAGRGVQSEDMPLLSDAITGLFFGGISLVSNPAADAYAELLLREREGRLVMMDPNIRASFITEKTAYRARLARMMGLVDIVKVSDEDLHWLVPGTANWRDKAQGLGPHVVLVTFGAKGAVAVVGNQTVEVAAIPTAVVDTVGAGDTFNAGVLAALNAAGVTTRAAVGSLAAADLRGALELGVKAAAVTVSRAGANPPWAQEI